MIKNKIIIISAVLIFVLLSLAAFFHFKAENSPENNIKIGIVSDIHSCSGFRTDLSGFVKKANEANTDFNVSLGDSLNFRVGPCSSSYREDLEWLIDNLRTNAPFYFLLGDHDIDSDEETLAYWKEKTGKQKSYYSFDIGNFHIIILDTTMGGEEMRKECQFDEICGKKQAEFENYKNIQKDMANLRKYLEENGITPDEFEARKNEKKNEYLDELESVKFTRSPGKWDKGRISENELDWLRNDLNQTKNNKVIIFSHAPLFPFANEEKEYKIINGEKLSEVLKESHKEIVSFSGDAHVWHEENIDKIQYYVIDRFSKTENPSAIFEWDKNGYRLIRN